MKQLYATSQNKPMMVTTENDAAVVGCEMILIMQEADYHLSAAGKLKKSLALDVTRFFISTPQLRGLILDLVKIEKTLREFENNNIVKRDASDE